MTKERKSNKESKKQPALTLMEKRAAKKGKKDTTVFMVNDRAPRGGGSGAKRG